MGDRDPASHLTGRTMTPKAGPVRVGLVTINQISTLGVMLFRAAGDPTPTTRSTLSARAGSLRGCGSTRYQRPSAAAPQRDPRGRCPLGGRNRTQDPRTFPALLIKKPSLFVDRTELRDDLAQVVRSLRRAEVPSDFRGIPGADLARWLPRLGRSGTVPSRLRCFRFSAEESRLLSQLSRELKTTEVAVLRRALRELGAAVLKNRVEL